MVVSHKLLDTVLLILVLLISLALVASFIQLILGGDLINTFNQITSQVIYVIFALTIVLIIVVLVLDNSLPYILWHGSWS